MTEKMLRRASRLVALVAVGAAAASPVLPATRPITKRGKPAAPASQPVEEGTLHAPSLARIMVTATSGKTDAFPGDPASKYSARPFEIEQSLREENDTEYGFTNARWRYDRTGQKLTLRLKNSAESEFFFKKSPGGRYVGSNAFGVKRVITRTNEFSEEITATNPGDIDLTTTQVRLAPEEARAVSD